MSEKKKEEVKNLSLKTSDLATNHCYQAMSNLYGNSDGVVQMKARDFIGPLIDHVQFYLKAEAGLMEKCGGEKRKDGSMAISAKAPRYAEFIDKRKVMLEYEKDYPVSGVFTREEVSPYLKNPDIDALMKIGIVEKDAETPDPFADLLENMEEKKAE